MIMPLQIRPGSLLEFGKQVLRGVGQVMFQNSALTGMLFLVGIAITDWHSAGFALFGTVVSTATALLLGAPKPNVDKGLYGLNGTLTGLGLATFLHHDFTLLLYVAIAAMSVTVVVAAIQDAVGADGYPLTGPFVLTTWIFIGALFAFGNIVGQTALGAPHLPKGMPTAHLPFAAGDVLNAILSGIGQVMLQQNPWSGALFLAGIAVGSRVSAIAAVLGSALGVIVAWSLGATPELIRAGVYGFNAALVAMALGGVFFVVRPVTVLFATIAACFATILFGSIAAILSPVSLPALTAPFVVTTWLCLLSRSYLPRLKELEVPSSDVPDAR